MVKGYLYILILAMAWNICCPTSVNAQEEMKPAIIYYAKEIMDGSWNELIHNGIVKFEKKYKTDVNELLVDNSALFKKRVNELARAGYNVILITNLDNNAHKNMIREIMLYYPATKFIVMNEQLSMPNAYYLIFETQQVSFLAGYAAAIKSKTKKLGFIGGMDIPLVNNFLCGYVAGAQYAVPEIEISKAYLEGEDAFWNQKEQAYQLTVEQVKNGVDIIFSAAGASTLGALQAAADEGKLSIGVDQNQNWMHPGSVLTSAMVRVDNAIFRSLVTAHKNIWRNQLKTMGLQEKGVELAVDEFNQSLLTKSLLDQIEEVKSRILLGELNISNVVINGHCEVNGQKVVF